MSDPGDYQVKRLGEMERAFGGALVRVRAELGISAFGVQVVDLPPDSGELAPEHDHGHDSQEELYVLLSGSAEVVVPDGVIPLDAETFIRLGPAVRRRIRSGPVGARLLMIAPPPARHTSRRRPPSLAGPRPSVRPRRVRWRPTPRHQRFATS